MEISAFSSETIMAILPEISLLVLAVLVLLLDMVTQRSRKGLIGGLTTIGFLAILVVTILFSRPESGDTLILGGMLRHDWPAFTFKVVLLFAAAVSALLSTGLPEVSGRGEYYVLLIVATLGMNLMAASADLMMLFLAIETTSIPLYILAGFVKGDDGKYSYRGATHHDLKLMREHSADVVQVKAAGGVRTLEDLLAVKALGVTRVGATSTVAMLEAAKERFEGGSDGRVPQEDISGY